MYACICASIVEIKYRQSRNPMNGINMMLFFVDNAWNNAIPNLFRFVQSILYAKGYDMDVYSCSRVIRFWCITIDIRDIIDHDELNRL